MERAKIEILSDQGDGKDIFEQFAGAFERAALSKESIPNLYSLMEYFQMVERLLQDLGEKIDTPELQGHLLYEGPQMSVTDNTKKMLFVWMALFNSRSRFPDVPALLENDLLSLIGYLETAKSGPTGKGENEADTGRFAERVSWDFDHKFLVSLSLVKTIEESKDPQPESDKMQMKLDELAMAFHGKHYSDDQLTRLYEMIYQNASKRSHPENNQRDIAIDQSCAIADGEDVIYTWSAEVWIDTRDAGKANKFMYSLCSALLLIEGVEIEIADCGIGSIFQRWRIHIKGWFAKEEVVQVMEKAVRAAEAYSLDRHIEPVEKMKLEREKISKDIEKMEDDRSRMMTEDQVREMHELELESKREDVRAKKLANIKQHLEIQQLLSERMAKGFVEVDSDYRIMINNLLAIKQTDKSVETGNIRLIGEGGEKEPTGT